LRKLARGGKKTEKNFGKKEGGRDAERFSGFLQKKKKKLLGGFEEGGGLSFEVRKRSA